MGNSIYIYRGLVGLVLITFASCFQKQDALIINANNSEPFVQVRCILVPGFPAQIHAKKMFVNVAKELIGESVYTLTSSDGQTDSEVVGQEDYREYFSFENVTIREGVEYTLTCQHLDEVVSQKTYIPKRANNITMIQQPYVYNSREIDLQVSGQNDNNRDIYCINPFGYSPANPGFPQTLYGDTNRTRTGSSFGLITQDKSPSTTIFPIKAFTDFTNNLNFTSPALGFNRYLDPMNNKKFALPFQFPKRNRLVHIYQENDSNRYPILFMAFCDKNTSEILRTIPERFNNETVPMFSNVPPFSLNIQSKTFKGFLIGFAMPEMPEAKVADNSDLLIKTRIFKKSGQEITQINADNIPMFTHIKYLSNYVNKDSIFTKMFDFGITQMQLDELKERPIPYRDVTNLQITYVSLYSISTDKLTKYYCDEPSFNSGKEFLHYLETTKEIKFYER